MSDTGIDSIAGLVLREIRQERGLTQDGLADKVGISLASYKRYEKGTRSIPLPVLYVLCDALSVSTTEYTSRIDVELGRLTGTGSRRPASAPGGEGV